MMREQMDHPSFLLDKARRVIVLESLREVCAHRTWILHAAHIRTIHVHAVVEADRRPEKIMNALKSYASRNLNRLAIVPPDRKRWARHGCTRWLLKDEEVAAAIHYVVSEQGEPMEVYVRELI